MRSKEYPQIIKRYGKGNRCSVPGLISCQSSASSGRICTTAIARNTPPANEADIPIIYGDLRHPDERLGKMPVMNVNKEHATMKLIFVEIT